MSDSPSENKPGTDTLELLKNARDMAFLFAVFLYFMGWVYVYYFLNAFGLSIKAVDADLYSLLIYSCNVFMYMYDHQLWLLIFFALVYLVLSFGKRAKELIGKLIPLIIIGLFIWTFHTSKMAAKTDAQFILDSPGVLRTIVFQFKDIKKDTASVDREVCLKKSAVVLNAAIISVNEENKLSLIRQSQSGSLRMLVANKEEYYLLQYTTAHYHKGFPTIYMVKKDLMESARLDK